MADPHDPSHKPHDEHPEEHAELHGEHHGDETIDFDVAPEGGSPLSDLGLGSGHEMHASSEDFDFSEPADFAFPGGQGGSTESGLFDANLHDPSAHEAHAGEAEGFDTGHFDVNQFSEEHAGATTEMPDFGGEGYHADEGIPEAVASGDEAAEAGEEEKPEPKKRRELPAWVHTAEWVTVGLIPFIAVVLNVIAIRSFKATSIDWTWHISYAVLLLLIPYALWRSKKRWMTPRITANYTVLLALAAGFLLTGVWMLGTELSAYGWQIKVKKVRLPSPMTSMAAPESGPDFLA